MSIQTAENTIRYTGGYPPDTSIQLSSVLILRAERAGIPRPSWALGGRGRLAGDAILLADARLPRRSYRFR